MKKLFIAVGLLALSSTAFADDFCGTRSKTVIGNTFKYNFRHRRSSNPETATINVTGVPWLPGAGGMVKQQLNKEMDTAISSSDSADAVKDVIGKISFSVGTTITFTSSNGGMAMETKGQSKVTVQDPKVFSELISFIEKIIRDPAQNEGGEVSCNGFPLN